FSSRRRHTRSDRDWSSDVCSSDLWNVVALAKEVSGPLVLVCAHYDSVGGCAGADDNASAVAAMLSCAKVCASTSRRPAVGFVSRSEERRVGKEGRSRGLRYQ